MRGCLMKSNLTVFGSPMFHSSEYGRGTLSFVDMRYDHRRLLYVESSGC